MRRLAFLLLFPFLLLPASADDLHDRFDKAVKELRSDDAAERDKGSAELEAIAKEAPELVRPLAEDKDPEVKARVFGVLKRLHLLPETEAEALFRKVEEKYANAKTVQYKVVLVAKGKAIDLGMTLSVSAKSGNQFLISGETRIAEVDRPIEMTCDGKSSHYHHFYGMNTNLKEVAPTCDGIVRAGMVRVGLFDSMSLMEEEDIAKMDDQFPLKDLKKETDDKVGERHAIVLTFSASTAGKLDAWKRWEQKIWVDAETKVLLKREATRVDGTTLTESYSDTKFDEEIPDEKFALPKER